MESLLKNGRLPDSYRAEFLLQQAITRNDWNTAAQPAQDETLFNLRSGAYYEFQAQIAEQDKNMSAASHFWKLAIYYYPDDPHIYLGAVNFSRKVDDSDLKLEIEQAHRLYGK